MTIKLKCKCGAEIEMNDSYFINGGGKPDEHGRVFLIEKRADEWLERHHFCLKYTIVPGQGSTAGLGEKFLGQGDAT
jgi:hypothetical protein